MPNHCGCQLKVKGPEEELKRFKEFAKGLGPNWDGRATNRNDICELDIDRFFPVPADILLCGKNGRDAFNSGGYDWVVANWGTKWGCYDILIEMTKRSLVYTFHTAWAPFSPAVLEKMSALFPKLKFELKYAEAGMGLAGKMAAKNGEMLEDSELSIKADREIRSLAAISG